MKALFVLIFLFTVSLAQAQTCPTPAQLMTDLNAATQAQLISLSGVNPLICPEVSMSHTWAGGVLIFSDSPETVTSRGKLYEDTTLSYTSGTVYNRVHVHHVNGYGGKTKMKFAILLKNMGTATGELKIQQKGTAGPSNNYLYAGKLTFYRWLTSTAGSPVQVTAGQTVRLVTDIETLASPTYLMTGLYDYSFTMPHTITVCALNDNDDPVSVCPTLAVLPRDTHQRGTFPNADKVYDTAQGVWIDSTQGVVQLPLAANTINDPNAQGVDKTDGTPQNLAGNYGVLYRMHLNIKAPDGKKIGFMMNPRGGTWGGAAYTLAGIFAGGKFLMRRVAGFSGEKSKVAASAKYNPGAGLSVWMQWMPTSASNLPLRFIAVPY